MKHALILFINLILVQYSLTVNAQTFVWKTPQPVTDSLSNNQNPVIAYLDYFDGLGYYVFWESSMDSLSTDIYVKNFYSNDDPQPLISNGSHHYQNPQIISSYGYYPPDSVFYLLYESNSSGNSDIYVVRISASTTSVPVAVTNDTLDDSHMRCNYSGTIVWENNGQILYSCIEDKNTPNWYVSNPTIISDSNSYNPVISWKNSSYGGPAYIAWEMYTDSNTSIYYSYRDNPDSIWSAPMMLHDTGHNINLRFSNDFWYSEIPLMTWDNLRNGLFSPMAYDFNEQDFYQSALLQSMQFTPTIFPIIIPVEFWDDSFFAVSKQVNSTTDIYVNSYPWLGQYYNLTETWQPDHNPQIFEGKNQVLGQDFILIWESERNNNWQLWSSVYTMPMGGMEESNSNNLQVKTTPNPFTTSTTFEYTLDKPSTVTISIFSPRGQLIVKIVQEQPKGEQQMEWNAEGLAAGMYYFRINSADQIAKGKLLMIQ